MIKILITFLLFVSIVYKSPTQGKVEAIDEFCKQIDNNKEFKPLHIDSYVYNKWKFRIGASGETYYFVNDSISKIEYYLRKGKHYDEYEFYFKKGKLIKSNFKTYDYRNDKEVNLKEYDFYFENKNLLQASPESKKQQQQVNYILRQSSDLIDRGLEIIKDWPPNKK